MRDPIAGKIKGRSLTLNGKPLNIDAVAKPAAAVAKPAARVVGGLLAATVVSAVLSSLRGQAGDD